MAHGLTLGLATLSHRPPRKCVRARSHPPELLFGTTTRCIADIFFLNFAFGLVPTHMASWPVTDIHCTSSWSSRNKAFLVILINECFQNVINKNKIKSSNPGSRWLLRHTFHYAVLSMTKWVKNFVHTNFVCIHFESGGRQKHQVKCNSRLE